MTEPFPHGFFDRLDPSPDTRFYAEPRFVTHIDDGAIAAVGELYAELRVDGVVLDLCSSWISHFAVPPDELVGLGLNAQELAANPALAEHVVQDLNADPRLPFADGRFDDVVCCVSIEYLARPLEVLAEVARVLRPGGRFVATFSNRMFPTKAWRGWVEAPEGRRPSIVRDLLEHVDAFGPVSADLRTPPHAPGDPLWGVWAPRR